MPNVVNNQLWTIPCELKCYIIIAIIGIVGLAHDRRLLLTAVTVLLAYSLFHQFWHHHEARWQNDDSSELVMCFLFGVLMYSFRDVLPHSKAAGIAAFVVATAIFFLPNGRAITPPLVAYVVAIFGLTNPRKVGIFELGADYSYGIYLYSTPIQQTIAQFTMLEHNGWINFAIALPLVLMIAALSWHFWEQPWLQMRHSRGRVDKWFSFTGPGKVVRHLYRLAAPTKA
jgi:peptidoglycan/LPS O-acetylase OafA/YrhL